MKIILLPVSLDAITMMDFTLTDEQRQYQQLARDFAQNEIAPKASEHDQSGRFPEEICRNAWELGLMNASLPEEHGGLGLSLFDSCLIDEEIAAGCTAIGTTLQANVMSSAPLIVAGNEEQREEFLGGLTGDFAFAAYCAAEPAEMPCVNVTAKRYGDEYVIDGSQDWVTNAGFARWYYVLATTDPEAGNNGLSAFVVPRLTHGLIVGEQETSMGLRARDLHKVTFQEMKIPASYRLGDEGQGQQITLTALEYTRPLKAAAAIGLARSAMEHSIRYAKERTTFGVPISHHQAVQFLLADMAKDIEAARLLCWQAAWLKDRGKTNAKEASMAKVFAADTAMKVATDAVQVFGGYGYSREYPVEKLMRDAKIFQAHEGTTQLQRIAIGQQLVGAR